MKILYWDRSGFCLWYKRLERGIFHLPRAGATALELDATELTLLLDGIDVSQAKRHARFTPRVGGAVRA